jgi:hypothetical protein
MLVKRTPIGALLLLWLLAAALAWGVPRALADTAVIGDQSLVANMANADQLGQNIPVLQGDAAPGYVLSSPATGTITSWSFLSGGVATGKQFELAVLAPVDAGGTSWRLLATSDPVAVTTATGTDAVNGPFPVQIPIDVGERIALMPVDDSFTPIETGTQNVDGIRYFSQPFGSLGSSQPIAPGSSADNGQIVPIQATVASAGGGGGPFTLTVHKTGTGAGTVTSVPAGIFCGAVCTHGFDDGTSVTLQVLPNAGSVFGGFSGDCSGTACTVQMTATRSVTAAFVSGPPRNTDAPTITSDYSCTPSRIGGCHRLPFEYLCNPGQWVARDPAIPYRFDWEQLYNRRVNHGFIGVFEHEAIGETYFAQQRRIAIDDPTGIFRCVVTATGPGGSTVAYSLAKKLDVAPPPPPGVPLFRDAVNIVVTGIEVTQAVQSSGCAGCVGTLPSRGQLNTNTPGTANYQGVTMASGKFTVVRVYAHPLSGTVSGATAQLEVFDSSGKRISVLTPDSGPAGLTPPSCPGICVDAAERSNPGASFNFLVPWEETFHRSLSFRATVSPEVGPLLPHQCGGCRGNVFTLRSVPFTPVATVPIKPIPLTLGAAFGCGAPGASGCTSQTPQQVFGDTQTALPVDVQIFPYRTPLAIDGIANNPKQSIQAADDAMVAKVSQRGADDGLSFGEYGVGVFYNGEGNLANGDTLGGHTLYVNGAASIVLDSGRSLTSVAHEISHGLGLAHADTGSFVGPPVNDNTGPHPDGTPDCGGNSNGQTGQTWPPGSAVPDNEGRLNSVGLDRRGWDIFKTGSLPSTFVEGFDHTGAPTKSQTGGARYYDYMSYCGNPTKPAGTIETLDWISLVNWNQLIAFQPPDQALPPAVDRRARAAAGQPIRVIATVDPNDATTIWDVSTGRQIAGAPTAGSPYRIELRDAAGDVLESVVPTTSTIHVDSIGQRPGLLLTATLPSVPNTAAVVVSAGGQVLTRRARSHHAPTGAFITPRPGSRVGHAATMLVRWTARDADGDRLSSTVDYSRDGGRSWKVVAGPVAGSSVSVPSRFLSGSSNARLRVRISDGFDVTTVVSGRLRAAGAPPVVRILGAPRRGRVLSTTTLLLKGSAFDDAGAALTGRRLRWRLGTRLIGQGAQITVRGLPPGSTTIRLIATDSHGRSAQATLPLRVSAVAVRYLLFDAPPVVSRSARRVHIRVASTAPATFTIAGRHFGVSRKPRTITIAIKPTGRSLLRFPCTLRSPGGAIHGTYIGVRARR